MKLSFKFKSNIDEKQLEIIEDLSYHTTKLYNIINYDLREKGVKNYYEIEKEYKSNWHCDFLHSHTRQQMFKVLEQNWKSYFASIKDFGANPSKYRAMPRPPRFKNLDKNKNEIIFTNLAIRYTDGLLKLSLSKAIKSLFNVESLNFTVSKKLQSIINWNSLQQARLNYDKIQKCWCLIIIYNKQELKNNKTNIMSIDLGLDNLATLTFKDGLNQYLFCGKKLKSVNSYTNKKIAHLQSIEMFKYGASKFKNTKKINKYRRYRKNYINDYMHKVSKSIIDKATENNVGKIVIGKLKEIKQNMDFNKTFVQIPIQYLTKLIVYKAKLQGIEVKFQEESYTSGCSAFDLESITKKSYDKSRRIVRGLFVSSFGIVNSDINGSLNILRKSEKCIPKLVEIMRDKGKLDSPKRIRVAC
ncbi:transposase [uncultured Clostridium sp.]|jgi:IS605 OrfB family transposase|uniref:RNA-guided endonuclease InsQ/TnpB family protein n=1 Tax=uncultured Clostridium sp. TaxID=59620 RepID=UPI00262F924C|nr:transposase [uncultured Clostridium sp.]